MAGIQKQGRLFEDSAVRLRGGDTVNLNDIGIGNYPTFDLLSSSEITSVKSHISKPGDITVNDEAAYRHDFAKMLGWGRSYDSGLYPLEQDAARISYLSNQGFPVPSELAGSDREEIVNYLQKKTIMRIPDDHIDRVRQVMEADIRNIPENYYLPENPTEEQIQSVLGRIQGTGLTSGQLDEPIQTPSPDRENPLETPQIETSDLNYQTEDQENNPSEGEEYHQGSGYGL